MVEFGTWTVKIKRCFCQIGPEPPWTRATTMKMSHVQASDRRGGASLSLEDCRCPVCLEVFIEPVTLPCTHTFCKARHTHTPGGLGTSAQLRPSVRLLTETGLGCRAASWSRWTKPLCAARCVGRECPRGPDRTAGTTLWWTNSSGTRSRTGSLCTASGASVGRMEGRRTSWKVKMQKKNPGVSSP